MSVHESGVRSGNKKPSSSTDEMSDQLDELRAEMQNLASSVTDAAGKQIASAQDNLVTAIRNNPLAAVGIAAGVGFLYGVIRR
jgi:ElaB/YqjD/DUF883 family membrane-anchored ribosome-binding protein